VCDQLSVDRKLNQRECQKII